MFLNVSHQSRGQRKLFGQILQVDSARRAGSVDSKQRSRVDFSPHCQICALLNQLFGPGRMAKLVQNQAFFVVAKIKLRKPAKYSRLLHSADVAIRHCGRNHGANQ